MGYIQIEIHPAGLMRERLLVRHSRNAPAEAASLAKFWASIGPAIANLRKSVEKTATIESIREVPPCK